MTSTLTATATPEINVDDRSAGLGNSWLLATLQAFSNLPWQNGNWRSDGQPTNPTAVKALLALLIEVGDDRMPPPSIVPAWNGGVQAEWHRNGVDLEIEANPDGLVEFFFIDADGAEHEEIASQNINKLLDCIQAII